MEACQGPGSKLKPKALLAGPWPTEFTGWQGECRWVSAPTFPLVRAQLCTALTTQHHTRLQKQTESRIPVSCQRPRSKAQSTHCLLPNLPCPEQHRCTQCTAEAQYPSLVLCEAGQALVQPHCTRGLCSMTQPPPLGLDPGLTVTGELSDSFSFPISRVLS